MAYTEEELQRMMRSLGIEGKAYSMPVQTKKTFPAISPKKVAPVQQPPKNDVEINLRNRDLKEIPDMEKYAKLAGIDCKDVTRLRIGKNKIKKINNLDCLVNLEVLQMDNNRIKTIENLNGLYHLKALYLNDNKITKIQGLDTFLNLDYLQLGNNKIKIIEGLDALVNLETLVLYENRIKKLDGVDSLHSLKSIDIRENNIDYNDVYNLASRKNLRKKGINVDI